MGTPLHPGGGVTWQGKIAEAVSIAPGETRVVIFTDETEAGDDGGRAIVSAAVQLTLSYPAAPVLCAWRRVDPGPTTPLLPVTAFLELRLGTRFVLVLSHDDLAARERARWALEMHVGMGAGGVTVTSCSAFAGIMLAAPATSAGIKEG